MTLNKIVYVLNDEEKFFNEILGKFREQYEQLFHINPPPKNRHENFRSLNYVELMLKRGKYKKNYWKFIEDVSLILMSVQKCSKLSKIYKISVECENDFNAQMDEFMRNKGYCCGKWHILKSRSPQCSSKKKCIISPNSQYYRYSVWVYCENCFRDLPENDINLNNVKKSEFKSGIFVQEEAESFVACGTCRRLFHERCVLHLKISTLPFCCKSCSSALPDKDRIKFSADYIPNSECDAYITQFLRQNNIQDLDKIVIRMVSNVTKQFKPKDIVAKYRTDSYKTDEIVYNSCVLFTFLKLSDESEICFFGVYFQLYGYCNCPEANKNSVYLSYIDSVKLCHVKDRTKLFQFILLGLFDYLKTKNYSKIFIWSCPPGKDDEYIFHMKPENIKTPTSSRLNCWYQNIMKIGHEKKIIKEYSGIQKYAKDENWTDINNIPYFEGDLWPLKLEETILLAENVAKKQSLKKAELKSKIKLLVQVQIDVYANQYFVLHLARKNTRIKCEPLRTIEASFINNRYELFDMFWEYKLQFSSERHAKFSTTNLIYRILFDTLVCLKCKTISILGLSPASKCPKCFKDQHIADFTLDEAATKGKTPSALRNYLSPTLLITPLTDQQIASSTRSLSRKKLTYDKNNNASAGKKKRLREKSQSSLMQTRSKKLKMDN